MKTGAVVVTYFPDSKALKRIEALKVSFDEVVVFDNSEPGSSSLRDISGSLSLIQESVNRGIAHALNRSIDELRSKGVDFICLLDQDSDISDDYVSNMSREYLERASETDSVIVPRVFDRRANSYLPFVRLTGRRLEYVVPREGVRVEDVTLAITSGTCICLSRFPMKQLFIDKLFIDHVDHDFCLRLKLHGGSIIVSDRVTLSHEIGEREGISIFGRVFYPTRHSPFRRYYIFRNSAIVYRKYRKKFPLLGKFLFRMLSQQTFSILFLEKHRFLKILSSIRGGFEGLFCDLRRYYD